MKSIIYQHDHGCTGSGYQWAKTMASMDTRFKDAQGLIVASNIDGGYSLDAPYVLLAGSMRNIRGYIHVNAYVRP